jgi:hypothetical protein
MTVKPIAGSPAPVSPEAFAEAYRRLVADSSIQFDLQSYVPPHAPSWLRSLWDDLQAGAPFFRILFWIGVAALATFIVYVIVRRLSGREWRWWRGGETEAQRDWRPAEAPARQLLAEADGLAARGLFSEAARLLLFRSVADIDARRPDLIRPALTSRDIAALPMIPERPRGAFARIAAAVERALFARRPLGADDWRDCRAAYEEFAFAEGWQG